MNEISACVFFIYCCFEGSSSGHGLIPMGDWGFLLHSFPRPMTFTIFMSCTLATCAAMIQVTPAGSGPWPSEAVAHKPPSPGAPGVLPCCHRCSSLPVSLATLGWPPSPDPSVTLSRHQLLSNTLDLSACPVSATLSLAALERMKFRP